MSWSKTIVMKWFNIKTKAKDFHSDDYGVEEGMPRPGSPRRAQPMVRAWTRGRPAAPCCCATVMRATPSSADMRRLLRNAKLCSLCALRTARSASGEPTAMPRSSIFTSSSSPCSLCKFVCFCRVPEKLAPTLLVIIAKIVQEPNMYVFLGFVKHTNDYRMNEVMELYIIILARFL